ncbi:hypothetical protein M0813_25108 [Anaeramoeba flamelloides]|uniref:Uncharacterized protein n=1 Tax=Anaeramoeba flamelloides TaxID=1746091 RepID=A0ABQ8Y4G4_9EUKA|nr:hypothetical protein M0813_25108 [Anaeramoeba flamelloides]
MIKTDGKLYGFGNNYTGNLFLNFGLSFLIIFFSFFFFFFFITQKYSSSLFFEDSQKGKNSSERKTRKIRSKIEI